MTKPTKLNSSSTTNSLSRRHFLRYATLAAGATLSFPYLGNVLGANDRINIACIGVGGKGDSDSSSAYGHGGDIVALCDADSNRLKGQPHLRREALHRLSQALR